MAFNVGTIEADLTLDRTAFTTELETAEAQARDFANETFEAKLGLNSERFIDELAAAEALLAEFGKDGAKAQLDLNTAPFDAALAKAHADAMDFANNSYTATLNANDQATPQIGVVRTNLTALDGQSTNSTLNANDRATPAILSVRAHLAALNGQNATANVNVAGTAEAIAETAAVNTALSRVDGRVARARVDVDTERARAGFFSLNNVMDGFTTIGNGVISAASSMSGALGSVGGIAGSTSGIMAGFAQTLGSWVAVAVAATSAIVALSPVVAGLAGSLGVLAGTLGIAAAGFGLVGAAAYRMVQGVKDGETAFMGLSNALDGFKSAFASAFEPAAAKLAEFSAKVLEAATGAMPTLGSAATAATNAMISGFTQAWAKMNEGGAITNSVKIILDSIPPVVQNISSGVASLGGALTGFLAAAAPMAETLSAKFAEIAQRLSSWANSAAGREQIRSFLETASAIAPAVADAITRIATAIANIEPSTIQRAAEFIRQLGDGIATAISAVDRFSAAFTVLGDVVRVVGMAIQTAGIAFQLITNQISVSQAANAMWAMGADASAKSAAGLGREVSTTGSALSGPLATGAATADQKVSALNSKMSSTPGTFQAAGSAATAAGAEIGTGFQAGATQAETSINGLSASMVNQFNAMNAHMANSTAEMVSVVTHNMEALANNVEVGMEGARAAFETGFESAVSTITSHMTEISTAVETGMTAATTAVETGMTSAQTAVDSGMAAITSSVESGMAAAQAAFDSGTAAMTASADAMSAAVIDAATAAADAMSGTLAAGAAAGAAAFSAAAASIIADAANMAAQVVASAAEASAAMASIGSGGAAYGGSVGMAHGGHIMENTTPLYTAASGLSHAGAHYVEGPTHMDVGGTQVLYGEALSGNSREYAFPMDNGYRFITEEPGFDSASFGLWADLGQRMGYFGANAPSSSPAAGSSTPSFTPAPQSMSAASRTVVMAGSSRSSAGSGVEARLESLERNLVSIMTDVRDATEFVPSGIRESVNHNLQYGRATRTTVLKGLSREARRRAFEGTFR